MNRALCMVAGPAMTLLVAANGLAGMSLTGLGDLPGGSFDSKACAVSGDGSTVVGTGHPANGTEAFRWTQWEYRSFCRSHPRTLVHRHDRPGERVRGVCAAVLCGLATTDTGIPQPLHPDGLFLCLHGLHRYKYRKRSAEHLLLKIS
jgi:hypothetical protein